jgi:hypothetical protein
MSRRKLPQRPSSDVLTHLSELLDEALEQTFPASDPVAINVELRPPPSKGSDGATTKRLEKGRHYAEQFTRLCSSSE